MLVRKVSGLTLLFEDFEFAVFDDKHNRVVNGIAHFVEGEVTEYRVEICDVG